MKKVYAVIPEKTGRIAPEIYGHFSEHIGGVFYGGLWVGKDSKIPNYRGFRLDAIEKFKKIKPGALRWPGGCFAETYDWRDGIGEKRPVRRNWWTPYDGRFETNEVGTHEFMDFCEAVGVKPYFAMNVTSITPMHAREWMDYCLSERGTTTLALEREKNGHPEPFDIPYWGVGNENWGGGGNMTADSYALEYRRFATLMYNVIRHTGKTLVAGGADGKDYAWTHDLAQNLASSRTRVDAMSFHYYTGTKRDCFDLSHEAWYEMISKAAGIEEAIIRHSAITKGFGMEEKLKLVIDEWGSWYPEGSGPSKGKNLFEEQ
ncbi:MAG: alpha-L-arabinofuranosidase, partial [Clostridia bacterium]|nr:alpha-L-arabinofuranosidase [Clostridia bacterium]